MVRLYKSWMTRIIIALVYLQKAEDADDANRTAIVQVLKSYRSTNPVILDQTLRAINRYVDPEPDEPSTTEVLETAIMAAARKKSDDMDLIDTIVSHLQLPNAAQYFNTAYLKGLRDAILRPDELIKWRKNANETLKCCSCGKDLIRGELMTVENGGDGSMKFACHKCAHPSIVACRECGKAMGIKAGFNPSKGVECGCRRVPAEPAVPTPNEAQAAYIGTITLNAETRRRQARAQRNNPIFVQTPLQQYVGNNPIFYATPTLETQFAEETADGPAE
jgi:hypothetical protein